MVESDNEKLNRLILAVAKGFLDCLDGIYSLAGGRMFAVALNIVGREYAEDIVHDSLIKIVRFAKQYKGGTNPYAYLCKIVRNTALDFLKEKRIRTEVNSEELFNLTSFSYSHENLDNALTLEQAMSKLEKVEKKVIYLSYYMDMTIREIAVELNLSKSAVGRIKEKGEEKLKNFLKGGTND